VSVKRIILKAGEERRVRAGHPWIYDNEVAELRISPGKAGAGKNSPLPEPGGVELLPGELADVESFRRTGHGQSEYLGRAMVNPRSRIIARIYSPSKEGMDRGFFKRRIREALVRRCFGPRFPDPYRESARLIFAEADFLPGLIVDRFVGWPLEAAGALERPLDFEAVRAALGPPASWLVVQFLCYGMDSRRDMILEALEETLAAPLRPAEKAAEDGTAPAPAVQGGKFPAPLGLPRGIIERSAAPVRELEGLPLREGMLRGSPPGVVVIFENGLPFAVDLERGQKTGCFLDQRENHLLAAAYGCAAGAPSRRVLDAFCYTGGFGIHAVRFGGAAGLDVRVLAVDSSPEALAGLRQNAALNGAADRITAVEANVFDLLRDHGRTGERFDLIILDPPAFAKSHSSLEGALRGYKEINLRAIRLLSPGGILVTCSCSHALEEGRFKRMITEAAADAERRVVQLDFRGQGADHPVLVGYDESCYLKCGYYRALN
jgi:23S rRNA (cytosine1962-C5)-methyltransferase